MKILQDGVPQNVTDLRRVGDTVHMRVGCADVVVDRSMLSEMLKVEEEAYWKNPVPGTMTARFSGMHLSEPYAIHGLDPKSLHIDSGWWTWKRLDNKPAMNAYTGEMNNGPKSTHTVTFTQH